MSDIPALFALATLTAAVLATIGAWAPRRFLTKLAALAVATLFVPLGYLALADLLSRPKPVTIAWWERQAPEATVLAGQLRENDGIYLWLALPGTPEPRAYRLPWNRNQAQQLQDAMRAAEAQGTGVKVRRPFAGGTATTQDPNGEPMFYPEPQPPEPEKAPPSPPRIFRSAALTPPPV